MYAVKYTTDVNIIVEYKSVNIQIIKKVGFAKIMTLSKNPN